MCFHYHFQIKKLGGRQKWCICSCLLGEGIKRKVRGSGQGYLDSDSQSHTLPEQREPKEKVRLSTGLGDEGYKSQVTQMTIKIYIRAFNTSSSFETYKSDSRVQKRHNLYPDTWQCKSNCSRETWCWWCWSVIIGDGWFNLKG